MEFGPYYYNVTQNHSRYYLNKIALNFANAILDFNTQALPIKVLCIGTDRATGDCFGPLIGSALKNNKYFTVEGTMENPIHALNLDSVKTEGYFTIAVDACLGDERKIGYIGLASSGITPGNAIGKEINMIGDMSLFGIVNFKCQSDPGSLIQNTRLNTVLKMVDPAVRLLNRTARLLQQHDEFLEKFKKGEIAYVGTDV